MEELPPHALIASYILLALLIISFIYALAARFINDKTLYDYLILPVGDEQRISYFIEPSPSKDENIPFPTVFMPSELYTSLVVPAFNEAKRITSMLDETVLYLQKRQEEDPSFTWEIIVVDDGSTDNTANIVIDYAYKYPQIRLLRQPKKMGKGAAIQSGCLHTRGELILMVDADGATNINEFGELEKKILELKRINKEAIVVGSRAHLDGINKANRTQMRNFLGKMFHLLIKIAGINDINDTQCGFKMFTREAARWIFPNQHIQRWCFDAELLLIGKKRLMEIAEVPVEWNEIGDSKMKFSAMIGMAFDLILLSICYRMGFWKIKMKSDVSIEFEL